MQGCTIEVAYSFGTVRAEVILGGRYADCDSQADDQIRSAVAVSLVQLPQWIKVRQQSDSDNMSTGADLPEPPKAMGAQSTGAVQRSDMTTDPQHFGDSRGAKTRIENGAGTIEVRINIQDPMQDQGSQNLRSAQSAGQTQHSSINPELLRDIADTTAASVLNHANASINHQSPTNDAFVQMMRYMFASRQLGQGMQSHDEQRDMVGQR